MDLAAEGGVDVRWGRGGRWKVLRKGFDLSHCFYVISRETSDFCVVF